MFSNAFRAISPIAMTVHFHHCDTSQALAERFAAEVADRLSAALAMRDRASLVVSGGKSPIPFFQCLARSTLPWHRVWITLADERWVDPASADSNERTVRDHLLQGPAAAANFVSLKYEAATPEASLGECRAVLAAMPRPFDLVVLGMGEDGHTASLFPGAEGLSSMLDAGAEPAPVTVTPLLAPHRRISLNLAALLDARAIAIAIQGSAKRAVLERALQEPSPLELPIAAVLHQSRVPVEVYLAP
jgi:6-phosphogluconolactonase